MLVMVDKVSEKKLSPAKKRREEEKEERRQQVLDVAEVVIQRVGWETANFGMIAKEGRLSRSLVYFYFETKDELFHAVCERGLKELERRFRVAISSHEKGVDQIMAIGRAYHRFAIECPLYFSLLSDYQARKSLTDHLTPCEESANAQGKACLALVAEALVNGLRDGSVRQEVGNPAQAAVTFWAFTHGLIQITMRKDQMLEREFGMNVQATMEHGFATIRASLSS
jgi:AcrR family transcriptional regulator